jgi:hypothetical protein
MNWRDWQEACVWAGIALVIMVALCLMALWFLEAW